MRPEAIVAVAEGMARWANPSSPHGEGRAARRALEDARARIAAALGWDGENHPDERRERGDRAGDARWRSGRPSGRRYRA